MLKSEKREQKKNKERKMKVTGRGVFDMQRAMVERANEIKYGKKKKNLKE